MMHPNLTTAQRATLDRVAHEGTPYPTTRRAIGGSTRYMVKQLIRAGLIAVQADGRFRLTAAGEDALRGRAA